MSSLVKLIILLSVYKVESFDLLGFSTGYRYLKKQMDLMSNFNDSNVETKWIKQPVDHFDKNNTQTWSMRYFENLQYWKPNGTIYLFIGGEGEAKPSFLIKGTIMFELAKETNGAMFGSEHRYYGMSNPFEHVDIENLKFLTSRQALADLETLLISIKENSEYKCSKVVVIGGSYPGNLAAWMRLLYPDLVDAAVASSAPVLAKKDFFEYIEQVAIDYDQLGSPECWKKIKQIFSRYDEMFKTEQGIKHLKQEEDICEDVDMSRLENRHLFFSDKLVKFASLSQWSTPREIKEHCIKLLNSSRIIPFKEYVGDELSFSRKETGCYDYDFNNNIKIRKKSSYCWTYQICTEFGYFQSTSSDFHPFTKNVPVEWFYKICSEMFGSEFNEKVVDEGVKRTNELYGGLNPNVTHVVFVNGEMDPWHRLGILEDLSHEAPARLIPRSSHCRDMFSNNERDTEELKEARAYVKRLIKSWLGLEDY